MPTKRRRESALEARCVKYARASGVVVAKMTECVGIPDRIFFVTGGRPLVVEFKARGLRTEEVQSWYLKTMVEADYEAHHCDTWEKFSTLWNGIVPKRMRIENH